MLTDPGRVQVFMHKFLFTHTGPGRIFIKFPFILTVPPLLRFTLYSLVLAEFWSNFIYSHKSSDCYTQFFNYTHGPCGILPNFIPTDRFSPMCCIEMDPLFPISSLFQWFSSDYYIYIFILLYLYYIFIFILYFYYIYFILLHFTH